MSKNESSPVTVGSTRPVRAQMKRIEREAQVIRQRSGLSSDEAIDPLRLEDRLGVRVASPTEVEGLSEELRVRLSRLDASVWSGMAGPLPDGRLLVILNPNQTIERARVTLLEEVAHRHYGHPPSQLGGPAAREYDDPTEREAYWTAAAVLVPAHVVARAVYQQRLAEHLAAEYGASVELVHMRIKLLGLWGAYQKYAATAEVGA